MTKAAIDTPPVVRPGRGNKRPLDLPAATAALLDDQARRAAARRERLRSLAQSETPRGKSELWERLRTARWFAQKTQREVAQHLGITRAAVTLWEIRDPGARTSPSPHQLAEVSEFLGVPLEYLMNDNADPQDVLQYRRDGRSARATTMHWNKAGESENIDSLIARADDLVRRLSEVRSAQPALSPEAQHLAQFVDNIKDPAQRRSLVDEAIQYLSFKLSR